MSLQEGNQENRKGTQNREKSKEKTKGVNKGNRGHLPVSTREIQ